MKRSFAFFAILLALPLLAFAANPGDVRINEVMYDDTATTDVEWVELYNTTGSPIDISGWWLGDCSVYPGPGTEGGLTVPTTTTIDSYLVICKVALDGITGEVICTQTGSWTLGNSGDNLALYDAATGGTLIDGSLTVTYPDEASSNIGTTIEKIIESSAWSGSTADWDSSTYVFATSGRYRFCTPGFRNSVAVTQDTTKPTIASATALSATQVDVLFSELVTVATCEVEGNYSIDNGINNPSLAQRDGSNSALVHLTVSTLTSGTTYTITINNVADSTGNVILPNSTAQFAYVHYDPNDIIITEIMPDPSAVSDANGEWFEIYNTTDSPINLNGWILHDNSATSHTIVGDNIIASHDYFVFCKQSDSLTNGGVPEDYAGFTFSLNNTPPDMAKICTDANVVVDSVWYTAPAIYGAGSSMQLRDVALNNDVMENWCTSLNTWSGSMGDHGTPGAAADCGVVPDTVDLTICQARLESGCGVPTYLDTLIRVHGIVSFADTCMRTAFLQDGGCGIALYGWPVSTVFPPPANRIMRPGDSVVVTGYLRQYAGLAEIASAFGYTPEVVLLDSNKAVVVTNLDCALISYAADAGDDSCSGEAYESEKIKVDAIDFIATGTFSPGETNYLAICASGDTIRVWIDSCSVFLDDPIPDGPVNVIGILNQYDLSVCRCQGYEIHPMEFTSAVPPDDPDSLTAYMYRYDFPTDTVTGIMLRWTPGDTINYPVPYGYLIYQSLDLNNWEYIAFTTQKEAFMGVDMDSMPRMNYNIEATSEAPLGPTVILYDEEVRDPIVVEVQPCHSANFRARWVTSDYWLKLTFQGDWPGPLSDGSTRLIINKGSPAVTDTWFGYHVCWDAPNGDYNYTYEFDTGKTGTIIIRVVRP
jgi:hypothetical protein